MQCVHLYRQCQPRNLPASLCLKYPAICLSSAHQTASIRYSPWNGLHSVQWAADVPSSRPDGSAGQASHRADAGQRGHRAAAYARLRGASPVCSHPLGCLHHSGAHNASPAYIMLAPVGWKQSQRERERERERGTGLVGASVSDWAGPLPLSSKIFAWAVFTVQLRTHYILCLSF